ncbi:hypothetical protein BX600DRAFT_469800 [Xylariales sp. PMI_506]|nr:hypothetical protein BX600DRAFT_469800 [Xylariales sp. PMI_506]
MASVADAVADEINTTTPQSDALKKELPSGKSDDCVASPETTEIIDGIPWSKFDPKNLTEDRTVLWIETRKLLLWMLAKFVIGKMDNFLPTIKHLAPIATTFIPEMESLDDILSRTLPLSEIFQSGGVKEEHEQELGKLIASAIFSRERDEETQMIIKKQDTKDAISNAYLESFVTDTKTSEEAVFREQLAASLRIVWLSKKINEGLKVDVKKINLGKYRS